jgi:hypothetical protein
MIYHGKEKENHRGSHVKYYHCGKWHEGTLLEPVNYQFVVTKENSPTILSTHTHVIPDYDDVLEARMNVADNKYTEDDLKILMQFISPFNRITEVESVEITDANDITQEEADSIIERLMNEKLKSFNENKEI